MTRCPTSPGSTPDPTAATTPHGSCPAITGVPPPPSPSPAAALPAARYGCRSLPHIPDALIARTTSPAPGVGSGNSWTSSLRLPRNTIPFMTPSLPRDGQTLAQPSTRMATFERRLGRGILRLDGGRRERTARPPAPFGRGVRGAYRPRSNERRTPALRVTLVAAFKRRRCRRHPALGEAGASGLSGPQRRRPGSPRGVAPRSNERRG